jgi:hypothetical protein
LEKHLEETSKKPAFVVPGYLIHDSTGERFVTNKYADCFGLGCTRAE